MRSLLLRIVIYPLLIGFYLIIAQCSEIVITDDIIRAGLPATYIHLTGDDIEDQTVSVFADQLDFFLGANDGEINILCLSIYIRFNITLFINRR